MGKRLEHKEGVYSIMNMKNDKRYIGEAKSIYKRWWVHRMDLRLNRHSNYHLQNAWNQYGERYFKFDIIEQMVDSTKESRLAREKYWTKFYNTENEDFGYNFPDVHSEEKLNKKKAKRVLKQRVYKKVYQMCPINNTLIKIWDKRTDVMTYLGITEKVFQKIQWSNRPNHRVFSYKGAMWVKEIDYKEGFDYRIEAHPLPPKQKKEKIKKNPIPYEDRNIARKPISLQNIETKEIKDFKSQSEVKRILGFNAIPLIQGFKQKGGGKKVIITQWKGWQIYKPTS